MLLFVGIGGEMVAHSSSVGIGNVNNVNPTPGTCIYIGIPFV